MGDSSMSGIWNILKTNNCFRSPHLLECEAEIQQLLQSVDAYVQDFKKNCVKEKQDLVGKVAISNQECLILKTTLDQKNQEIGKLRSELECFQKQHQEAVAAYERELFAVKDEASCLRRDHEKLQQKYEQRSGITSPGKSQRDQDEMKLRKLSRKLEDYRQRSLEWEHEKRTLQKQLEVLQSENKLFSERNETVSKQLSGYQSQLQLQHSKTNESNVNLNFQLEQLQDQLEKAQDSISLQDRTITRMKMMYEESVISQRRALHEKEQLEEELKKLHQVLRTFEEESCEVQRTVEFQREAILSNQKERGEISRQVVELELMLKDKESIIRSFGMNDSLTNLLQLQSELNETKLANKNLKATEKLLNEEISRIRDQLNRRILDCDHLSCELKKKGELHAVRLENHHHRGVSENNGNLLEADKTDSDRHLLETQDVHADSRKTLELRNSQLEKDLLSLKIELQKMEETVQAKIHIALKDKDKTIQQMKDDEKRRIFELSDLNKRQIQNAERQFCETIEQFEAKIEQLQRNIFSLENELELKNSTLPFVKPDLRSDEFLHHGGISLKVLSQNTDFLNDEGDLTIDSTDVAAEEFRQLHEANNQELENKLNFLIDEIETVTGHAIRKTSLLSDCSPKHV